MKTKREKVLEQINLMEVIQQKANINIVACCSCDSIILHDRNAEEIECPYCGIITDSSNFSDYLYSGMENNEEFEDETTKENFEFNDSLYSGNPTDLINEFVEFKTTEIEKDIKNEVISTKVGNSQIAYLESITNISDMEQSLFADEFEEYIAMYILI